MNPLAVLLILIVAFWLWMLVDCIAHEPGRKFRIAWIAVLTTPIVGAVAALAYFFGRMLPRFMGRLAQD